MRIRVTNMRVFVDREDNLLALCDVLIAGDWRVNGVRVLSSNTNAFVSLPSRKTTSGGYEDIVHPTSREGRAALTHAVLEAYDHETNPASKEGSR